MRHGARAAGAAVGPRFTRPLCALAVVLGQSLATLAHAEPASPSPGAAPEGEVDAWFEQANGKFAAGDYAGALELLDRACAQSDFPGCALNLGAVHHALRHCAEARGHYEVYLQRDPGGERAAEARAALDELAAHCRNEGASGATGAAALGSSPARPRLVDELPEVSSDLPVREWSPHTPLPARTTGAAAPSAAVSRTDAALPGPALAPSVEQPQRHRAVAASVMVLGGVAGLTSIFLGMRLSEANDAFRRHRGAAYDEAQAARLERARDYRAFTVGSGVASGVLLGVGGALWWLGADADDDPGARVGLALDEGAGVRVRGRF